MAGDVGCVFEVAPELHSAHESGEDFGEVELHEVQDDAFEQPREDDSGHHEDEFHGCVPRTAGGEGPYEVVASCAAS